MTPDFADDEAERILWSNLGAGNKDELLRKEIAQALRKAVGEALEKEYGYDPRTSWHCDLDDEIQRKNCHSCLARARDSGFSAGIEAAAKEAETTVSISDQHVVNHIAKKIRQLRPEGGEAKK